MLQVTSCPVCQGTSFTHFLSVIDYTVSHETFQLVTCEGCSFVITNPRPTDDDLGKYYVSEDYISHTNKSNSLLSQVYKIARKFTLRWKYNLVRHPGIQGAGAQNLLDYGCGTGSFLLECKKRGMKICGVEPSAQARTIASACTGEAIASDIEQVHETFDTITLWHVLEHVSQLNDTLAKLKERIQKNGTIFIAVPNLQSLDAQTYEAHWAGYDVPRHLWHFSRKTMELLLTRHNLKLIEVIPMKLDAYYVSLLSEKYKRTSTTPSAITNATILAWKSNQSAVKTNEFSSLIYIARPNEL